MITRSLKPFYQFAVSKKKKNLYDILKISRSANPQDIKASYYKLAKQYHPDTHQGSPNVAQTFKQINEAYNILRDAQKRRQYDEQNFTAEGQKKEYKFYDTQHSYGYNSQRTYRKNPYQSTNPFQSSFNSQNPYKQSSSTNPYNSYFSSFYSSKQSSSSQQQPPNPNQSWQQYVKNEHRKNVAQNRKLALNRLQRSNTIVIIILGVISVYVIGELTFKIYEFNNFYRVRSYAEKLDPRELQQYQERSRMGVPRKDYY